MPGQLEEYIKSLIKKRGPLTFEEYMDLALYHHEWGYYTQKVKIGLDGDYYTSSHVTPLFGQMLAHQFYEMWVQSGEPGDWNIVEYGPGEGLLGKDVLCALRDNYPVFYDRNVNYWCVEKSNTLSQRQKALLEESVPGKAAWVKHLSEIAGTSIYGCIFANELIDAMPVHMVLKTEEGLKELYVNIKSDELTLEPGELSTTKIEEYFSLQETELENGQTAEVNLNALSWLKEVASFLNKGFLMTIDYGGKAEKLYSAVRFDGTIRCFSSHQMNVSPLENIGEQDITASVNFTALQLWGEELGLKSLGLVNQSQFLINLGILDEIKPSEEFVYDPGRTKKTLAVKQLIMPEGMGNVFKILVQSKGFNEKPRLTGMRPGRGLA